MLCLRECAAAIEATIRAGFQSSPSLPLSKNVIIVVTSPSNYGFADISNLAKAAMDISRVGLASFKSLIISKAKYSSYAEMYKLSEN